MNTLRRQMEADMVMRGLAYRTREAYINCVAKFAKHYGKRPDQISEEEVQRYLLYLLEERKLAHSSCNVVCSALQFFYRVTLKRREAELSLPRPRVPLLRGAKPRTLYFWSMTEKSAFFGSLQKSRRSISEMFKSFRSTNARGSARSLSSSWSVSRTSEAYRKCV
jgi:hypothetical protein